MVALLGMPLIRDCVHFFQLKILIKRDYVDEISTKFNPMLIDDFKVSISLSKLFYDKS